MFSNGSLLDEYCQLNSIFFHFECKSVSYDDTNNISWRINSCYSHYYLLRLLMMHGIISVHLKTTYTCWQYIVLNIVINTALLVCFRTYNDVLVFISNIVKVYTFYTLYKVHVFSFLVTLFHVHVLIN